MTSPPPPKRVRAKAPPPPTVLRHVPRPRTGLGGDPDNASGVTHMLAEVEKGLVRTLCGVVGHPPGMFPKAGDVKTTGWPTWVTCPTCLEQPGVRPVPPPDIEGGHPEDCECRTFFRPVDLSTVTKGYNG